MKRWFFAVLMVLFLGLTSVQAQSNAQLERDYLETQRYFAQLELSVIYAVQPLTPEQQAKANALIAKINAINAQLDRPN